MTVLIKGMKIPQNCEECDFAIVEDVDFDYSLYCKCSKKYCDLDALRHPIGWNCPLVEVPQHGRLIDADALKEEGADIHMDYVCDGYVEDTTWGYSDDLLDSQPTIIEAEVEDVASHTRQLARQAGKILVDAALNAIKGEEGSEE